ncbi:hypothetical protein [Streptomyces hydrogenans]|uniref:hypothetical protein n=1 Tax=Streptomyces hydrogenans TaxID=1873719 RepID=UPI0038095AB3
MIAQVRASRSVVSLPVDDPAMLIATNELGYMVKRATKPTIGTMLANLRWGNARLIVERVDEELSGSWYIQVLLRENNAYQLG